MAFVLPHMTGGGAERVALRLIEDFVARGHPVDLVLMTEWGELLPLLPPTVRVIDLHAPRIRDAVRPLARYLRAERPEGLQAFMWPLTVAAVVAHRLARSRARLVLSEHITLSKQYAHFGRARRALLRQSIHLAYPRADARVAVSAQAADDLATVGGIARGGITVIHNPIAPAPERAASGTINNIWRGDRPRILTVGTLKRQKNHRLLLAAFELVRRERDAELVILGDGELADELALHVNDRQLTDSVSLPGFRLDPWPYFDSADVFVLSSDYEGYGNVLVEAMKAGLSIVSTDCESGPREILDGGRYGRLVPCGDTVALARAIVETLDDPAEPAIMRQRAADLDNPENTACYLALMSA